MDLVRQLWIVGMSETRSQASGDWIETFLKCRNYRVHLLCVVLALSHPHTLRLLSGLSSTECIRLPCSLSFSLSLPTECIRLRRRLSPRLNAYGFEGGFLQLNAYGFEGGFLQLNAYGFEGGFLRLNAYGFEAGFLQLHAYGFVTVFFD
jgi:hypothetical protein